jgi:hypothetical protein
LPGMEMNSQSGNSPIRSSNACTFLLDIEISFLPFCFLCQRTKSAECIIADFGTMVSDL